MFIYGESESIIGTSYTFAIALELTNGTDTSLWVFDVLFNKSDLEMLKDTKVNRKNLFMVKTKNGMKEVMILKGNVTKDISGVPVIEEVTIYDRTTRVLDSVDIVGS